jgi:DNA polymerase III subunit epsilon
MNNHPNLMDRRKSCLWASALLADHKRVVILDTETTGFKKNDEIVQISIMDLDGEDLCTTLVAMTKRKTIPSEASGVHGIKKSDLDGMPTYASLSLMLQRVLRGKRIIAYNAEFDLRMMQQVYEMGGGYKPEPSQWECAMLPYAAFVGEWNDYHNDYKWQKLGGTHNAQGDVDKTIQIIKRMANFLEEEREHEAWSSRFAKKRSDRDRVFSQIQSARRSISGTKRLFSVFKALDSTGIPAGVFFFVGGLMLSLVALFGFGYVLVATGIFLLSCVAGIFFFVLETRNEEEEIQISKQKRLNLERVLEQKEAELASLKSQEPIIS